MAVAYAYETDTGIAILYPDPNCPLSVAEILAKDIESGTTYYEINTDDIPDTNRFRTAWKLISGAIDIDVSLARECICAEFRAQRVDLLEALDVAHFKAVETGDTTAQATIAAEKQALRDVPAHADIQSASTLTELEALDFDSLTAVQ